MNTQMLAQQLAATFDLQLSLADQLLQVLSQENAALAERQRVQAQALSEQKASLSQHLEEAAVQQIELLRAVKLPYQADSFDKLIATLPTGLSQTLQQKKLQLEQALEQCQEQNALNGQIINLNQQAAETALAILRGQLDHDNLGYTARGKTLNQASSTPIAKA